MNGTINTAARSHTRPKFSLVKISIKNYSVELLLTWRRTVAYMSLLLLFWSWNLILLTHKTLSAQSISPSFATTRKITIVLEHDIPINCSYFTVNNKLYLLATLLFYSSFQTFLQLPHCSFKSQNFFKKNF